MTELDNDSLQLLSLLETQTENFPALNSLVMNNNIITSSLFLPQTLKTIDSLFETNDEYMFECLKYLDTVSMFSISIYGDPLVFIKQILDSIIYTRTVPDKLYVINTEYSSDFIFSNREEALVFLESNKYLLAIYLFTLIKQLFYKK